MSIANSQYSETSLFTYFPPNEYRFSFEFLPWEMKIVSLHGSQLHGGSYNKGN